LTRNGDIVPFEVNASMLVHLHNEQFPYEIPSVLRIKSAFAALLQRKVTQAPYRTRQLTFEDLSARAAVGAKSEGNHYRTSTLRQTLRRL
jgi:hypothetical protein